MTSSWRGFARDWSCVISALNHFNVWVCRASAGECKGRTPQPAKLNRLLNWLFCCKWNRFGQSLHKLRISVSWGACYCFSMTPLSPAPPNLCCPELRTEEESRWERAEHGKSSGWEARPHLPLSWNQVVSLQFACPEPWSRSETQFVHQTLAGSVCTPAGKCSTGAPQSPAAPGWERSGCVPLEFIWTWRKIICNTL